MRLLVLLFCLLMTPVWAQDEITQISYWADQFGNQGSFWKLIYQGKTYVALKVKSPDKPGEANVLLDKALMAELEQKVTEMKTVPNTLKNDGIQVLWSKESGDSKLSTMLGRWHGVRVKLIQVEEKKDGVKEHQITLDKGYGDFQRALKKARPVLGL